MMIPREALVIVTPHTAGHNGPRCHRASAIGTAHPPSQQVLILGVAPRILLVPAPPLLSRFPRLPIDDRRDRHRDRIAADLVIVPRAGIGLVPQDLTDGSSLPLGTPADLRHIEPPPIGTRRHVHIRELLPDRAYRHGPVLTVPFRVPAKDHPDGLGLAFADLERLALGALLSHQRFTVAERRKQTQHIAGLRCRSLPSHHPFFDIAALLTGLPRADDVHNRA